MDQASKRVAAILSRMIEYLDGNLHDINHFLQVYGYAKTIGELEGLDGETQERLEVAAIIHDIAVPFCREKYGHANGPEQEREGTILAAAFLADSGYSQAFIDRIVYLVGHHHTLTGIEGSDYQILIEADYLVNAGANEHSKKTIENMTDKVFRTETGKSLIRSIYKTA